MGYGMLQQGPAELGTLVSLGRSPRVSPELFVGRQSNTRHQGSVLVFHQPPGPVQVQQVQMHWYKAGVMLCKAERRRANRECEVGRKTSKTRDREMKKEKK